LPAVDPGFYLKNTVMLGKTHLRMGNTARAREFVLCFYRSLPRVDPICHIDCSAQPIVTGEFLFFDSQPCENTANHCPRVHVRLNACRVLQDAVVMEVKNADDAAAMKEAETLLKSIGV
jgi:hypothetical protein